MKQDLNPLSRPAAMPHSSNELIKNFSIEASQKGWRVRPINSIWELNDYIKLQHRAGIIYSEVKGLDGRDVPKYACGHSECELLVLPALLGVAESGNCWPTPTREDCRILPSLPVISPSFYL